MAAADLQDQIHAFSSYLRVWNDSYAEYAKSLGLSHAGLSVLNCIYRFNGECTQKMLCTYCYLPKQTVNSIVTAFYKQGWVRLEELPEDRRNKTIHFTEEGQRQAQQIVHRVHESERKAMSLLSPEEREIMLSATQRYTEACRDNLNKK